MQAPATSQSPVSAHVATGAPVKLALQVALQVVFTVASMHVTLKVALPETGLPAQPAG